MRIFLNLIAACITCLLGCLVLLAKDYAGIILCLIQIFSRFIEMSELKKNVILILCGNVFFGYMIYVALGLGSFTAYDLLPFGLALIFIIEGIWRLLK